MNDREQDKFLFEEDRLGFIRKVYGIMSTQLLLTALVTLLPYLSPGFRGVLLAHPGVALSAALMGLFFSCCLFCVPHLSRQVPTNYIALGLFTLCEAYTVAFTCAVLDSNGLLVVQAAFLTAGLVIGLTFYAVTTKHDFTLCGGLIWSLGSVFLMVSILALFFGPTMRLIYCALGVMVFSVYLIFDTQFIVGGEGRYASINKEDYILGAVMLYLDILNLFLYIIQILSSLGKND
jgi:FtsH-binding integral membrane protein